MTNEDYQKILHEIKNNVTLINSSLQLVAKKHPRVNQYSYWNDAMEEIDALKKMLLELSSARLSDNLDLQVVTPEDFLSDLKHSYTSIFDQSNFQCIIHTEASLPSFSADVDRLKRALWNLLKNSYEAMDEKGQIQLNVYQQDSFICFDLIDYGGGISPDYLPKLFTPFETTKTNGTGLGLMISKQIIDAHGGKLSVISRPGDGCTFSISLPCIS